MATRQSVATLLARLGHPADYWPTTGAETTAILEAMVDLLRDDATRSGYKEVYAVGGKWQAKVYVGPGKQRNLGSFNHPRDAAGRVLDHILGEPLPPSPKPRNKRGAGRKPRVSLKPRTTAGKARVPAAQPSPVPRVPVLLIETGGEARPGDVVLAP
jgi:hypothetical protein